MTTSGTIWCTSACPRARTSRNVWWKRSACLSNSSCPLLRRGFEHVATGFDHVNPESKRPGDKAGDLKKITLYWYLILVAMWARTWRKSFSTWDESLPAMSRCPGFLISGVLISAVSSLSDLLVVGAGWNMWRRTRKAQSILTGFGRWLNSTRRI